MKKLATIAFLVALVAGVGVSAHSSLANEGRQNFYYYFGAKCPCAMPQLSGCGAPSACAPVDPCCC